MFIKKIELFILLKHNLDSFELSYKHDLNVDLFVVSLEKKGFTKQKYKIKVISDIPEYNQEMREFRPYLTL